MRPQIVLSITLAVIAGAMAGCGSADRREYTLQGQILSMAPDHKDANIKHEEIPGFMAAMTMSYKVRDAKEFADLKPGDLITSTLVVVSNDAYLRDVRKVGEAPLEKAPADTPAASSGFELLRPGDPVPNTSFVDQDGKRRDFAAFKSSIVLVTFIFTRCPMPMFCPLMDRHFAAIQERLKTTPALNNVQLVSVSFDPITDTPPVLKKHANTLGADPKRWTFLTGDRDEVDRFAARFGLSLTRELNDQRDITHTLRTAIVDKKGALVKVYVGNEWSPDQALADLTQVAQ